MQWVSQIKLALERYGYRKWIRSELSKEGSKEYLRRLESDLGVEHGYFQKEAKKKFWEE